MSECGSVAEHVALYLYPHPQIDSRMKRNMFLWENNDPANATLQVRCTKRFVHITPQLLQEKNSN